MDPSGGRHPHLSVSPTINTLSFHHRLHHYHIYHQPIGITTPQQAALCFRRQEKRRRHAERSSPSSCYAHFASLRFSRMMLAVGVVFVFFVVVFVGNVPGAFAANLTCYSCITFDENNVCYANVSAAPIQHCNKSHTSCSVYREDLYGKFVFVVRGCNSSCVQKCGVWGQKKDIDKCSSCCDTDLCNTDDGAFTPRTASTTFWVVAFSSWVLGKLTVGVAG